MMKRLLVHFMVLCMVIGMMAACDDEADPNSEGGGTGTEEGEGTEGDGTEDDPDPEGGEGSETNQTQTTTATARFIAVGDGGKIIYSDNNGAGWTHAVSGTSEVLRDAVGDSAGNCVVVGYNGTILYSANRGVTWQAGSVQTINHLKDVETYGAGKFIAVAEPTGPDPYAIFRSTDGGRTWDRRTATVVLKGIGMRSDRDFVAVGQISGQNVAVCMLTYTGGDQWGKWTVSNGDIPAGTPALYDVVHSGMYFIAVGRGVTLYSQGGGNWTTGATSLPVLYRAARCNTSSRTVAVGIGSGGGVSKGRIYYSTSSRGTSWNEVSTVPDLKFLHDVATDGKGRFVAVGEAGEVVYSEDTGNMSESATIWARGMSGVSGYLWGVGACPL